MMCLVAVLIAISVFVAPGRAQTAWHTGLWGANGGIWSMRVPIVLSSATSTDIPGYALRFRVGDGAGELPLAGQARDRLRVCNQGGTEYLYHLSGRTCGQQGAASQYPPEGSARRGRGLRVLPVEKRDCPSDSTMEALRCHRCRRISRSLRTNLSVR